MLVLRKLRGDSLTGQREALVKRFSWSCDRVIRLSGQYRALWGGIMKLHVVRLHSKEFSADVNEQKLFEDKNYTSMSKKTN